MFAEKLAPFLAQFGEAVTVAGVPVAAFFDEAHVEVLGDVASTTPAITAMQTSVPAPALSQAVVVRAVGYTVAGIESPSNEYGPGFVTLKLFKS